MADDLLPLLLNVEESSSESDEDDDEEVEPEVEMEEEPTPPPTKSTSNTNYDPSLPTAHSYLGTDLEEYSGRTVLDDDSYLSLPFLTVPNVVLIPGQTLPLHLFQPRLVAMMKRVLTTDRTFGLVPYRYNEDYAPTVAKVGTTAEIFSVKEESEAGIDTIRIKATGRQRFELIETRRQTDGVTIAKVKILADRTPPEALLGAKLDSGDKLNLQSVKPKKKKGGSEINIQPQGVDVRWLRKRKFSAANLTWWPSWVYEMYDATLLMSKIRSELSSWYEGTSMKLSTPENPSDFSFWVASNLPLSDTLRLHLLEINSPIQRLRCELDLMKRCTVMCCKDCGQQIANKTDVFSLSLDGPMAAYVNPGGYVHDTLTCHKAHGLSLIGRASTENSWFPGYAWTICQCRGCASHMGWKFTSVKKKLKPEKFWGLCRSALFPGIEGSAEPDTEWQPIM